VERGALSMPVETRAQLAIRYRAVVEAAPQVAKLVEENGELESNGLGVEETLVQQTGWWKEEESGGMASGTGAGLGGPL
jgi:hypothetical protein